MKICFLMTREEAEAAGLTTYYSAHRNDIELDDGRGGYRSATRIETLGKVVAVIERKRWREHVKPVPSCSWQQCYCSALQAA